MKVIATRRGGGKTIKCFKRAIKLLKRGQNVIFITPLSQSSADIKYVSFNRYLHDHNPLSRKWFFPRITNTIMYKKGNVISILTFITYDKYCDKVMYYPNPAIIIDDLDYLFNSRYIDTVSITK